MRNFSIDLGKDPDRCIGDGGYSWRWTIMIIALIVLMTLDYITGIILRHC